MERKNEKFSRDVKFYEDHKIVKYEREVQTFPKIIDVHICTILEYCNKTRLAVDRVKPKLVKKYDHNWEEELVS